MSEYGNLVKAKCDAFADRVVKLNDYMLKQESLKEERVEKFRKLLKMTEQYKRKNQYV